MNNLQNTIEWPTHMGKDSKVWIYQSNRPFTEQEVLEIDEQLHNFYCQWTSHGVPVKGWAKCIYNQFVIAMADEVASNVSGCSTDSMVRIIKSIERQYQVNLFDRLSIAFLINNKVQPLPYNQVNYALSNGYIQAESRLFNNLVATKAELEQDWLVPLNKSWLWNKISQPIE
jgi:hypothetical protein